MVPAPTLVNPPGPVMGLLTVKEPVVTLTTAFAASARVRLVALNVLPPTWSSMFGWLAAAPVRLSVTLAARR